MDATDDALLRLLVQPGLDGRIHLSTDQCRELWRLVAELRKDGRAAKLETAALRGQIDALERSRVAGMGSHFTWAAERPKEKDRLDREVRLLRAQLTAYGWKVRALREENGSLRVSNDRLVRQLGRVTALREVSILPRPGVATGKVTRAWIGKRPRR